MSVVIDSITRQNPAPCQHWVITGTIDGNPNQKTSVYHTNDVLTYGDDLAEGPRKAFILMSLRRHYELGGNRAQIIGVDLEGHLGPPSETFLASLRTNIDNSFNKLLGRENAS